MKRWLAWLVPFFPWKLRRWLLVRCWRYEIAPDARIGLSWIFPEHLKLGPGAYIGHLTLAKGLALLELNEHARIGNLNWITGFPEGGRGFFAHQPDRRPRLVLGRHAAVTNRHLIDCTHEVRIGEFSTVAGFRTQILTHSIDLAECRQHSEPVAIGAYCFVGTGCTLLGGARLPDYSVLGAASLLNKAHGARYRLYGGVPARELKELNPSMRYFQRKTGFVN